MSESDILKTSSGSPSMDDCPLNSDISSQSLEISKVFNLMRGNQSLLIAKDILDEMGINFFLIHGTLLGLVRDGFLVPYDSLEGKSGDIDLASFDEMPDYMFGEFTRIVQRHGLKMFEISAKEENGKRVVGAYIRGTPWAIGIEFWKLLPNDEVLTYDGLQKCPFRFFRTFKEIKYRGKKFSIPGDSEGFLEFNYGKSWRTHCVHAIVEGRRVWVRCDLSGNIIKPVEIVGEISDFARVQNFREL